MTTTRRSVLRAALGSAAYAFVPVWVNAQSFSTTVGNPQGSYWTAKLKKYHDQVIEDGKIAPQKVGESDKAALKELHQPRSLYNIFLQLGWSAVPRIRLGYFYHLTNRSQEAAVTHGWAQVVLGACFREQDFVQATKNFKDFKSYSEEVTSAQPDEFWDELNAVCGQFSIGDFDAAKRYLPLIDVYLLRKDFEVFFDEKTYRFPFELVRFLASSGQRKPQLASLDRVFPLNGIAAAWADDTAFAKLTDKWCEWHLSYGELTRENIWGMTYMAKDFLFPTWIFALDAYRQRALGRSALGNHELIQYGRRIRNGILLEKASKPLVLTTADGKYVELYPGRESGLVDFWRKFTK